MNIAEKNILIPTCSVCVHVNKLDEDCSRHKLFYPFCQLAFYSWICFAVQFVYFDRFHIFPNEEFIFIAMLMTT